MIRLSVTDLETLRYWKEREDAPLEELIAQLTGVAAPTPQMEASRAFHRVLETLGNDIESVEFVGEGGFTFDFDCDCAIGLPKIRELKGERIYHTTSGPVTLVGKVDGMEGLIVRDYKLSERFEAERYLDSLQWRAYLEMFHASRFVYYVFQGYYDRQDPTRVRIVELHDFPLDRYPGMGADVAAAVEELAGVVAIHCPQKVAA